jgi:Ran GTPase-activating protein (RanGAP) involved in mRNA processing and transport
MLSLNKTLTHVELRGNKIGDRACAQMFSSLTSNSSLVHLDLGDNQLGGKATSACAEMLRLQHQPLNH